MVEVIEDHDQSVLNGFRQFVKEKVGKLITPQAAAGTKQTQRTLTKLRDGLLQSPNKVLKENNDISIGWIEIVPHGRKVDGVDELRRNCRLSPSWSRANQAGTESEIRPQALDKPVALDHLCA